MATTISGTKSFLQILKATGNGHTNNYIFPFQIISNEIRMILSESFEEAIGLDSTESWLKLKYQDINNQIISAQKSRIQNK